MVHWNSGFKFRLLGNGLTLPVASLLYLSMVWNLDEWLSSWYSSECLLRVCITFWKGRKEGTAKMNQWQTEKKKYIEWGRCMGKQRSGSEAVGMQPRQELRDGDADRSIDCCLMLVHHPFCQFSGNFMCCRWVVWMLFWWKMTDRNCYRLVPVSRWSC